MNNKGQTLILFVILIPVALIIFAFVCDTGLVMLEKTKLNSATKTILKNTYKEKDQDNYQEIVKNLYEKNNIIFKDLKIKQENSNIFLEISLEKESVFGKIIGIKSYPIKGKWKIDETLIVSKE